MSPLPTFASLMAAICGLHLPASHLTQTLASVAPATSLHVPPGQLSHFSRELSPDWLLKRPLGHSMQALRDNAPSCARVELHTKRAKVIWFCARLQRDARKLLAKFSRLKFELAHLQPHLICRPDCSKCLQDKLRSQTWPQNHAGHSKIPLHILCKRMILAKFPCPYRLFFEGLNYNQLQTVILCRLQSETVFLYLLFSFLILLYPEKQGLLRCMCPLDTVDTGRLPPNDRGQLGSLAQEKKNTKKKLIMQVLDYILNYIYMDI